MQRRSKKQSKQQVEKLSLSKQLYNLIKKHPAPAGCFFVCIPLAFSIFLCLCARLIFCIEYPSTTAYRMTDGLQKLFGTGGRVKLLRLFLFNPRQSFGIADVAKRARVSDTEARHEVVLFSRVGLVVRSLRRGAVRYSLNPQFVYTIALQNLLLNAPARGADIVKRIRGTGVLKFVVLSGIFMGDWDDRLDLLVVGDKVKERALRERIRGLEAEIGKEVRYALLTSEDFLYRFNMNDKLVRDVLDYPHKVLLDKLDLGRNK